MGRNTERARGFGALVRKQVTALGLQSSARAVAKNRRSLSAPSEAPPLPEVTIVDPEGGPTGYM